MKNPSLIAALGIIGFALFYFLSEVIPVPLAWYFPLENRWEWTSTPSQGLKMGWYGKVLLSLFCGGLFSVLGTIIARFKAPGDQLLIFGEMSAMGAIIFVLYYFAKSMAYRVI